MRADPSRSVFPLINASRCQAFPSKDVDEGASPRQDATNAAAGKLKAGTTHTARLDSNTVPSCEGVLPHQEDIAARTLKPSGVLTTAERQDRQEKKSAHELSGHGP